MTRPLLSVALVGVVSFGASAAFAQSQPAAGADVPPLPALAAPAPAPPPFVAPSAAPPAPPAASPAPPAPPVGYGAPPPGAPPPSYGPPPGWGYPYASSGPPRLERYSTPMFVGGIVALSLGGVGLIAGSVLYGSGASKYDLYCTDENGFTNVCGEADDPDSKGPGLALLIAGGVLVAGGIPLVLVGGRRVPKESAAPPVTASVGPRGASLRITF
jgi:hypothetical protein